jgi:hypothetical protein
MMTYRTRAAVVALAMTMPAALHAQRGMGPGPGINSVAPIIDLRRELNLTSRQLVRLDSIERTLVDRNQVLHARVRSRLDSLRPKGSITGEEEIQWRRTEGDSLRALHRLMVQNDSVARGAAMAILTDSQRVQVRERIAERRGFMAGSRMRGGRGMRRPPRLDDTMPRGGGRMGMAGPGGGMGMGMRGPGGGMGMGMRSPGGGMGMGMRGPGGRMGMSGPRGMRGPDQFGPGFYRRGVPDDIGRPMFRRRGGPPPDSLVTRDS